MQCIRVTLPFVLFFVFSGCASIKGPRNILLSLPQDPSIMEETGTLIIRLSTAMNVSVTIDDRLVVEGKNTQKIQVDGLGAGSRRVRIFGGGSRRPLDKIETIEIIPGEITTMSVSTPPRPTASLITGGIILVLLTLTLEIISGIEDGQYL